MEISIFAEGESICIIWSESANEFVHLKTFSLVSSNSHAEITRLACKSETEV